MANNPILMTKVKNTINKQKPGMNFYLRNISINGVKKGCSGFVENPANGSIVYLTTEENTIGPNSHMYRYADHVKDYSGYCNRWAKGYDALVVSVCQLLDQLPADVNDFRI